MAGLATVEICLMNPRPQRHEPPREEDEVEVETGSISGSARRPTTPINDLRGFARELVRHAQKWRIRAHATGMASARRWAKMPSRM